MEALLKKFGITIPEKFDIYNLIGVDYGDGEISAAYVSWNPIKECIDVLGLALAANGILMKNPNAYYININEENKLEKMVYSVNATSNDEKDGGFRYYNFKKCVGTAEAKSNFLLDNGTSSGLTYEDVMAKGFNCLVNVLFEANHYVLDRNKPTIILVGRPSSPGWVYSEKEYAKLLQNGLKLPENQKPVYVAIQSESTAALAREIDPKWDKRRVQKGEIVVVLDNGSSTFDVTVITPNGVEGEDSYQFGGNLLDENLLNLMYEKLKIKFPNAVLKTTQGHKLGLRMCKEAYYGIDGSNYTSQIYNIELLGADSSNEKPLKWEFKLDDQVMDFTIGKMPVSVFHFKKNMNGTVSKEPPINCSSWLDGCRTIYQSFYDSMKPLFKTRNAQGVLVPDRIILSGGVSVMKEVQDVVYEVFGIKPEITDHPNYSVSEGLAYVLGTEIKKGQLLKELINELDKVFPDNKTLKNSIADAGADKHWKSLNDAINAWVNMTETSSIQELDSLWRNKYFNNNLNYTTQLGVQKWFDEFKIPEEITKILKEYFDKMFPDYVEIFKVELPEPKLSNLKKGVAVHIIPDFAFMTNPGIAYENGMTAKRDQRWRQEAYNSFLGLEDKIRNGGERRYTRQIPVEKGIFNKHIEYVNKTITLNYQGIRSFYMKDISSEFLDAVRKEIVHDVLIPALEEYVETITPYFNMTARKEREDKNDRSNEKN